jgi:hypothetical protein
VCDDWLREQSQEKRKDTLIILCITIAFLKNAELVAIPD